MNKKYIVKNAFPAGKWQDATPLGNGRVGALVYGSVYDERILLNHESLYYGATDSLMPDVSGEMPYLRKLLDDGKYLEAENFYKRKLRKLGYKSKNGDYLPAFDIRMITNVTAAFKDYSRELDMMSGIATVGWRDGDVDYKRKIFVDYDSGKVVFYMTASKSVIDFQVKIEKHDLSDAVDRNGKKLAGNKMPSYEFYCDKNLLIGRLTNDNGKIFVAETTLKSDGEVKLIQSENRDKLYGMQGAATFNDNFFSVKNASEITLVCDLYEENENHGVSDIDNFDYEAVKKNHAEKFSAAFSSCELSLTDDTGDEPTEMQRVKSYNGDVTLSQIEKQALFGRYLLIASSANCRYPANLQGIWNGAYRPAWSSTFFNNENIQMCYWQALSGNLAFTMKPFFDYYLSFMDDFRENAQKLYGCRGILLPLFSDNASGKKKNLQPHVLYWTAGSAWIADMFFEYYLCTRDKEFLAEKAYPFMKEAALFFEDFMQTDENGYLKSYPSDSPENCADGGCKGAKAVNVCINATMDFATLKALLSDLLEAEKELGVTDENDETWRDMLKRIPPYKINEDGAIAEWIHDDFKDNYAHRHLSHLYPLFPGREITEKDERLFTACKKAIDLRRSLGLKEQTGWSFAHLANLYASAGEGEKAEECLKLLIRFCVGENLFTYHNDYLNQGVTLKFLWAKNAPFQVDANMGFTAAVQNMLVKSTETELKIFAATPRGWGNIRAGYCLTRCGVKVRLTRLNGDVKVLITALCDTEFTLSSGLPLKDFSPLKISLKAGETYEKDFLIE